MQGIRSKAYAFLNAFHDHEMPRAYFGVRRVFYDILKKTRLTLKYAS